MNLLTEVTSNVSIQTTWHAGPGARDSLSQSVVGKGPILYPRASV